MRLSSIGKSRLSWLAVVLGIFLGLFELAVFGTDWAPFGDRSSGWFLTWFTIAGTGLIGLTFITGSIVALRNRKSAGTIFLVFIPVAAYLLADPTAGFLVWHADGGGYWETPLPSTGIGLTALFFAPFLLFILTRRHKKRAVYLFTVAASVVVIVFSRSRWTAVLLPRLVGWSAPFLLFGLFWLGTHKLGWPSLLRPRPRAMSRRISGPVITCLAVFCLDIVLTLGLSALGSSLFSGDCIGKRPITHPESPSHAVFTARIVFVGRSIEALTRGTGLRSLGVQERSVGDWAVGVVQERFWGLPSWGPHLVLLTNFIYWKGETYFIDGARANGLLTRVLLIVEARIGCSRSRPVQDAIVDLRVLRGGQRANGARLIGYVRRPEVFTGVFGRPPARTYATGARIEVTGTAGTITITTDQTGIYQLDGLPPGDYTLQLSVPDNQVGGFFESEGSPAKVHLNNDALVESNFDLFWNGRIEGRVQDDSGKPARVWVMLINADGKQLPGNVQFFLQTNLNGTYLINKIPAGRYRVLVDPNGPNDEWPYDIQYYPSALRPEDAKVLQLDQGQEIKGVDFTVRRLAEREVQVRITWPNGSPVTNAPVYVAYEHTKEYESLRDASDWKNTDQNGLAVIHLHGNSRVRLFGEQSLYNEKTKSQQSYYSHPVESDVGKVPDKIDLVLNSPTP